MEGSFVLHYLGFIHTAASLWALDIVPSCTSIVRDDCMNAVWFSHLTSKVHTAYWLNLEKKINKFTAHFLFGRSLQTNRFYDDEHKPCKNLWDQCNRWDKDVYATIRQKLHRIRQTCTEFLHPYLQIFVSFGYLQQ